MPPTTLSDCTNPDACDQYRDLLVAEADALLSRSTGPDLVGDDAERFEAITVELGELRTRRDRIDQILRADAAGLGRPGCIHPDQEGRSLQHMRRTETRVDIDRSSDSEIRDAALATLERSGRGLGTSQGDRVDELLRSDEVYCDGSVIAKRTLLTENPAYRSAWAKVMTKSRPHLTGEEADALDAFERFEKREMNILTPGDGGYGVPVFIDPSIILTDQEARNFYREICTVRTITTSAWKGVSAAGVTWVFETESAASNDISPTLAQPAITVHKAQGFIPYTIEVGMDYPDFAGEMARLLGEGYEELLVNKLTVGTGSTQPWGIFTAIDQTAGSEVAVTSDGNLLAADIYKVWKSLPQKFRRRASWVMNVDVNNEIRSLGDDKLHQQTVNLRDSAVDSLMGRPVYESPYAPEFTDTTGAANILVVGDFSRFYLIQRAGMSVEPVQHVFDTTTGTPNGQRGWYAWGRVGADSVDDGAFRLLQNT